MLFHCFYQLLNCLLPSHNLQKQDNLQNKCAQKVNSLIKNKKDTQNIIAQVPAHLFRLLFQTQVLSFFSEYNDNPRKDIPESLFDILLHWPYKRFTFINELPLFPPLENDYKSKSLSYIHTNLLIFCGKIASFLRRRIIDCLTDKEISRDMKGPLQLVDLSGPYTECGEFLNYTYISQILEVKCIPNIYPRQFKMIDDVNIFLNCDNEDVIKILWKLCDTSSETKLNSLVKFNSIRLTSSSTSDLNSSTEKLIPEILRKSGCKYVLYDALDISEDLPTSVLSNLPVLSGIRFSSYTNGSVSSLPSIKGLTQLSISNINLNGKLEPLCNSDKGLTYLRLTDCCLKISDLVTLAHSPHPMTLRQLDLSCNDLAGKCINEDFLFLFRKLIVVEILDMSQCNICYWPEHVIDKFVNILIDQSHLSVINMEANNFSMELLNCPLTYLGKSKSLRYLSLGVVFDEDRMKGILETFSQGLNSHHQKKRFAVMRLKQYYILAITNLYNLKQ